MSIQLVWFKRDLRTHDHAALSAAASRGSVLCVYVIEPSYWRGADASGRQFAFLHECLRDLYRQLKALGVRLHVITGEVLDVLSRLKALTNFEQIHSHEETGNALTYQRDIAVATWCKSHAVQWHEYAQQGVVRSLQSRNTWAARWTNFMAQAILPTPTLTDCETTLVQAPWPDGHAWGLPADALSERQIGGRTQALAVLAEFLSERSAQYRGGISSPLLASSACSRLSPYLSLGCVSMRETVQATQARIKALAPSWQRKGLSSFLSRLHWHCHFIQKLESEPEIEWRNMHRGYDNLRETEWNALHFERLTQGRTGWPLVDACVMMLKHTGWLNFRMRAMLVSVASYPLWLHWKPVGDWLATQFVDYEPGIHWSQMQMQSGTTGINATRVYNPIKQALDHDPQGVFVRNWLPVLRRVPDAWIFEPWKMPPSVQASCGVLLGRDWPEPIVDLALATRSTKLRLHALRQLSEVKASKAQVLEKHGSRKNLVKARLKKSNFPKMPRQLELSVESDEN